MNISIWKLESSFGMTESGCFVKILIDFDF